MGGSVFSRRLTQIIWEETGADFSHDIFACKAGRADCFQALEVPVTLLDNLR
jgi:hypothetical protein